jgi:hypothetical protein
MRHARRFLYQSGGVRLTPQTRAERHLSGSEREEMSRGIAVPAPRKARREYENRVSTLAPIGP